MLWDLQILKLIFTILAITFYKDKTDHKKHLYTEQHIQMQCKPGNTCILVVLIASVVVVEELVIFSPK